MRRGPAQYSTKTEHIGRSPQNDAPLTLEFAGDSAKFSEHL
jgi:hypothetical protein